MRLNNLLPAVMLAMLGLGLPSAADSEADGFLLRPLAYPGQSATATLPNGEIIAFDGWTVARHAFDGDLIQILATLPSFVFPSFAVLAPSGAYVLIGESSNGDVFRVDLTRGDVSLVTNLFFNFDAAFEDDDHVIVSAASCGFGCGNQLFRVTVSTGATVLVADVAGSSGPVAVHPGGDVYYATLAAAFPAPAGSTEVIRWDPALLDGITVRDETDATIVAAGFDGAAGLAIDPVLGDPYVLETNFGSGINRVRRVGTGPPDSPILVEGAPFLSMANLEFSAGDGKAFFRGFQPESGGTLRYSTTDFFSVYERNQLEPLRPPAFFTGPGTSGPGALTLELEDGPSNGLAFVIFGSSANCLPDEMGLFFPDFADVPLFTCLAPGKFRFDRSGPFFLDGAGDGSKTYPDSMGATGVTAYAVLVGTHLRVVGTSVAASF